MEIMLDGRLITCTPEEYIELKRLGAFGDKPAEQGTSPKLGDGYDEWLTRGRKQVVAVYGCNMPGPLTCSGNSSDASNRVGKTGLSADTMSRLDAVVGNPTIVRLSNPEIDPAGGYFHYVKLDKDGKTYLNDNELEPWMVDAAISEKTYDALGGK